MKSDEPKWYKRFHTCELKKSHVQENQWLIAVLDLYLLYLKEWSFLRNTNIRFLDF